MARAGAGAGRGRCCGAARISNRYVREFVAECLGTKKGLGIIYRIEVTMYKVGKFAAQGDLTQS